jgi:single-stranded-DNA-specific exonuclease
VDCGIKSTELITYAKALGIDFIICDHHLPDPILPPAVAILNAKQIDCGYPYKELCGCGVVFKLITALAQAYNLPEESYLQYLDLVATAIAADIVPLTDENRTMAFFGLEKVNENPSHGILALLELAKQNRPIRISNLVFAVAPRINAAGRMDDAKKAVQLFIEASYQGALDVASLLQQDNLDRREADSSISEEAFAEIENDPAHLNKKSTVVFQPHWHKGVVGIVASRLIERHYKPTIVLTQNGDIVSGSARSVQGFNLYEALHACREHLLGYGGHFAAAGLTLLPENIEAFTNAFEQVVTKQILPHQLIPEIQIDAVINFSDITYPFYKILQQMEPFGPENMKPVFIARGVNNTAYSKIVKEQHIRFVLQQDGITLTGIGFKMADKFALLQMNQPLDIVFTLDENEWNNEKTIQLKMIDLRLSA